MTNKDVVDLLLNYRRQEFASRRRIQK